MIWRIILLFYLIPILGCASFSPQSIEEVPFRSRSQTKSSKSSNGITVSAVVLGDDESKEIFGVNLAAKDIQPVWLSIKNNNDIPCVFFPITLDPDYFSPNEAAFMNHYTFGGSANKEMDEYFDNHGMHLEYISPGEEETGFVFSNMDPGIKHVEVTLYCFTSIEKFVFFFEVPGFQGDYDLVDWENLYSEDEIIDYNDEENFSSALEELPCCTTNRKGTGKGNPINLVLIADTEDIFSAFIRRGWDVTEPLSEEWKKVDLSKIFSTAKYRTTPMSKQYVFGRSQDFSLQKTRQKEKGKLRQRNELRVWLAPFRFKRMDVWIGSTTRDIGSDITRRTEWYLAQSIDPEVDEARAYLMEDIGLSNNLSRLGYVSGTISSTRSDPVRNFKDQPWWSDGKRVVLFLDSEPTSLSEIEFLNWDRPGDVDIDTFLQNNKNFNKQFDSVNKITN